MKKSLFVLIAVLFATSMAKAQINLDCSGNVGIGVSPSSNKLEVSGAIKINPGSAGSTYIDNSGYSGKAAIYGMSNVGISTNSCYDVRSAFFSTTSDERLKENIKDITNSLDLILRLKGKRYDYKTDTKDKTLNSLKKNQAGYLAQEVVKIIPEAVLYDDSTDIYAIDYTKIIPFITEAIKEQQGVIENLQAEIQQLKTNAENATLKSATLKPGTIDSQNVRVNELRQNTPNPFSQTTSIGYSLSDNVQKAMICIYDMNGAQLKCIPLDRTAAGNILINGNEFKAGMYMYSLIADGQLVDTKRMVLTE